MLLERVVLFAASTLTCATRAWRRPTQITETIDLFSQVGLEVAISELDLDVLPPAWFCLSEPGGVCDAASHDAEWVKKYDPYGQTGALPAEAALAEQQRFGEVFAAFLSRSAAIARVTFWCARAMRTERPRAAD